MRKNLTTSGAWFLALFCVKMFIKPDLSWWWVALPQILVPVEAVLTVLFNKRFMQLLYWYNIQIIKMDGRIKLWAAKRQAKNAYNKANQNKFKI